MKLWLTRVDGGRYILTLLKPSLARIRGTDRMDAYEMPGEPIAVRGLCPGGVQALFGVELAPLEMRKVEVTAKVV